MGSPSVPAPPLQPSMYTVPVPGRDGWYYDSSSRTAWRRGSKGGERDLYGGRGRTALAEFDDEFRRSAEDAANVLDRMFHPENFMPEMPEFSFPEIKMPEMPKFPDPPAPPVREDPQVKITEEQERKRLQARRSRGRSILTGGGGLTDKAPTGKKTLLGQ